MSETKATATQAAPVESSKSNAGLSQGQSAVTLAANLVTAIQTADQARREEEKNERIRKAAYLKANMPLAEVFEVKGKHFVYIPNDIRMDIRHWDDEYEIVPWNHVRLGNELDYVEDPIQFAFMKQRVAFKAIDMFQKIDGLEKYVSNTDESEKIGPRAIAEITKVIEALRVLYKPLIEAITVATPESEYTFEELTVVLGYPGTKFVVLAPDGGEICLTTKSAEARESMMGPYIKATGEVYVRNPELSKFDHEYYFGGFIGKCKLLDLGIIPVNSNPELQKKLIERGQKYIDITANPSYYAYKGDLLRKRWRSETAFRATGRVMVDFPSMQEMDPNYNMYFGGNDDDNRQGYKVKDSIQIDDNILMTLSPYVYGFSFLSKVWGELKVENISPIKFREDAYDKLVMEEDQKSMILSLVETQLEGGHRSDLIDGKGGGCIFLLAGEPGTGKTLTAEVTAEKLKRPLYMVGVGELGTTADELELNLRQILDIASTWNAVLLLDECDIFMEARTDSNIQRNAMVGVFLRLLEYYQGILFLTSNRAANIDKAFYSRISMALNFPDLATEDRIKIWSNILSLNNASLDTSSVEYLAEEYSVNGRQIKNACRNAIALAQRDGRKADLDDYALVLDKGIEFQEAVFARGNTNDMRLTGMHHDNPNDEPIYVGDLAFSASVSDGFFTRAARGLASFFNILGGAK